jgi:hypothetical protein
VGEAAWCSLPRWLGRAQSPAAGERVLRYCPLAGCQCSGWRPRSLGPSSLGPRMSLVQWTLLRCCRRSRLGRHCRSRHCRSRHCCRSRHRRRSRRYRLGRHRRPARRRCRRCPLRRRSRRYRHSDYRQCRQSRHPGREPPDSRFGGRIESQRGWRNTCAKCFDCIVLPVPSLAGRATQRTLRRPDSAGGAAILAVARSPLYGRRLCPDRSWPGIRRTGHTLFGCTQTIRGPGYSARW